jgi:uncharacterized protein (TIGR03032 family)
MTSIPGTTAISTSDRDQSASASTFSPNRKQEELDFHYSYSESLPPLLAELKSSLLVTTYTTGNLVAVSQRNGRIVPTFHTFDRPMGVAVNDSGIAVATRSQVWFLRSAPDIAAKLDSQGRCDGSFLARHSHFTGDIHCHDVAWAGKELWLVNTLFSCLCTPHPAYNFAPRWRPPFVSALVPEDRCHLNGLATANGKPRFVTAMAETDSKQSWRAVKKTAGCVIEIESGATIARGLTMPHSPRLSEGKLYLLHSGLGRLETVDTSNGHRDVVRELPGYTRGLAILGSLAFVGLSRIRTASDWEGVPIARHPDRLKCGVWVVDLKSGNIVGSFEFTEGAQELFDVQVVAGIAHPFLSGPLEENPVWTVMPSRKG